jgi:hypothetical protein
VTRLKGKRAEADVWVKTSEADTREVLDVGDLGFTFVREHGRRHVDDSLSGGYRLPTSLIRSDRRGSELAVTAAGSRNVARRPPTRRRKEPRHGSAFGPSAFVSATMNAPGTEDVTTAPATPQNGWLGAEPGHRIARGSTPAVTGCPLEETLLGHDRGGSLAIHGEVLRSGDDRWCLPRLEGRQPTREGNLSRRKHDDEASDHRRQRSAEHVPHLLQHSLPRTASHHIRGERRITRRRTQVMPTPEGPGRDDARGSQPYRASVEEPDTSARTGRSGRCNASPRGNAHTERRNPAAGGVCAVSG